MNSRILGGGFLAAIVVVMAYVIFVSSPGPETETEVGGASAAPARGEGTEDQGNEAEPAVNVPEASEIPDLGPAPALAEPLGDAPVGDLPDIEAWLNTDAESFEQARGKVTIVQFWTFGCFNCKNTLPHLRDIYATYQDDGLQIIGVHAPEFDYEREIDAIAGALVEHDITWPVAVDNSKTNFRGWQPGRRFWPRTFVVDADNRIRFDHIGEGAYDELEATVAALLNT